jgi:hypothetical protein
MTEEAPPPGSPTSPPEQPITLGAGSVVVVIVLASIVTGALAIMVAELRAPALSQPTPAAASAELGYFLGRWGLALVLIGFVPLVVIQVMRAFKWGSAPAAAATPSSEGAWGKAIEALPMLVKTPVGVGMALILISALLLLGASLGSADENAPSPTPTPSASVPASPSASSPSPRLP